MASGGPDALRLLVHQSRSEADLLAAERGIYRYRSVKAASSRLMTNWFFNFLVSLTFLPLIDLLS